MSAVKRAKWIEGITKSNRILRDIADIATSAVKDENGIAKGENWELVYPRPFVEIPNVRGKLIQDTTHTKRYIPAYEKVSLVRATFDNPIKLEFAGVIEGTVKVYSEDLAQEFKVTEDYTVDHANNQISVVRAGAITEGESLHIKYSTTFHSIVDTLPVRVEKVLTISDPDRAIQTTEYTLDHAKGRISFISEANVPTDAAYYNLSFTERTDTYTSQDRIMITLESDPLDELSFILPANFGEVMKETDVRAIGSALAGGKNGTGEVTYEMDPVARTVTFAEAPVFPAGSTGTLHLQCSMFNTDKSASSLVTLQLSPKIGGTGPATVYNVGGALNELNDGQPHSVQLHTTNQKPILYKHLADTDAGFETIDPSEYIVNYDNPMITLYTEKTERLLVTFTARDEYNLSEGLAKITDRVVLKTTTTPEYEFNQVIQNDFGATDTDKNLTMFVEFNKPARLVNPETGLERYLDHKGVQHETQANNHYIQSRLFDRWDDANQKPADATYDISGELIDKGAYVSDWTKYSWFQDWKEYMRDELDDDAGSADVSDGILFQEVKTTGMSDEFPVQFWISANNNRLAMVLMGDPTLDQDNFLTSFGYFGRIHPFYDEECQVKLDAEGKVMLDAKGKPIIEEVRTYFENDVRGNFAMTAGSSSIPALIGTAPKNQAVIDSVSINMDTTKIPAARIAGDLYDFTAYSYLVTYLTEVGESRPTPLDAGRVVIPKGFVDGTTNSIDGKQGASVKLRFRLPDEATGYRIYRYHKAKAAILPADADKTENYKLLTTVDKLDRERTIDYIDTGIVLPVYEETFDIATGDTKQNLLDSTVVPFYRKFTSAVSSSRAFESVTRDVFTGAILDVKFSSKWGKETATGVSDIVMFQTRSGLKYQKHYPAYITTEEFMKKEKSGQSRWTGKFHLSPIYIEHSYDKQRGWLDGVMAVDDSGIEHLDELIVDKDTPKEEVYKFFRVNAPYSMFNNSPNYSFGLAIIKSSMKWD